MLWFLFAGFYCSVKVYTDTFIPCLKGGAFDSLFCSEMRIFVHKDCPGRRVG